MYYYAEGTKPLTTRAWVDVTVLKGVEQGVGKGRVKIRAAVDGYNAPLAAGRFMELARGGFFDGKKAGPPPVYNSPPPLPPPPHLIMTP